MVYFYMENFWALLCVRFFSLFLFFSSFCLHYGCSSFYFFFVLLSQLPVMPKRRKLSQAELEIHHVLSPDDSASTVSVAPPAPPSREHVKILSSMRPGPSQGSEASMQAPATLADMRELFGDLKTSFVEALHEREDAFVEALRARDRRSSSESDDSEYDEDEEVPGEQPPDEGGAPPLFGVDVNEPQLSPEPAVAVSQPLQGDARVCVPGIGGSASAPTPTPLHSIVPDASLPRISRGPAVNWDPDLPTLAWAESALDNTEWTKEDRDAINSEFTSDPAYEHLFTAVPMPSSMYKAMDNEIAKKRDYLLSRVGAEDIFHDGQKDLCSGSRVLLDVISDMAGKPDMLATRNKLATVYQSMASNMSKTSRGRREIGRRFVRLDKAPALYDKKPSHFCFFGGKSLEDAMKVAKEESSVDKDLILMPRRTKQPFLGAGSGAKSSWAWKNRSSTQRNFGKSQSKKSNFSSGPRGKGKRRGSRGRRKPKAATQE